jgi:glycosyltransferase involved in cell wall biosynthesis
VPTVVHVLPHRGGGAETYIDALEPLEGFEHRRIALSNSRRPLAAVPSILGRLPQVSRAAARADLVHVHGDAAALLTVPVRLSAPVVWTTHGLHLLRRSGGVRRVVVERGLRSAVRRFAFVICTSEEERRELAAFLPESVERLRVVVNGVAVSEHDRAAREAVRSELGLEDGTCAALFLGQLEARKDPLTMVRAVLALRERGLDVAALVAGAGPLEPRLRALEGPGVKVLGFRADAARLLEGADVFVLPSAREGLSFALLEAMAKGLPPVVADGPGNAEVVAEAGLVFPFGDAAALSAAIGQLVEDAGLRAGLGEAERERARASYGLERFRTAVEETYRDALRAPGQGGVAERA